MGRSVSASGRTCSATGSAHSTSLSGRTAWCLLSPSQGVTKRRRLSWLTNSALVYEPKYGEWGGEGVLGSLPIMSAAVHSSPNKLGDLTPYLTYAPSLHFFESQYVNVLHAELVSMNVRRVTVVLESLLETHICLFYSNPVKTSLEIPLKRNFV